MIGSSLSTWLDFGRPLEWAKPSVSRSDGIFRCFALPRPCCNSQDADELANLIVEALQEDAVAEATSSSADVADAKTAALPSYLEPFVKDQQLILRVNGLNNDTLSDDLNQQPTYLGMCRRLYGAHCDDIVDKDGVIGGRWTSDTFLTFAGDMILDVFDDKWSGFGKALLRVLSKADHQNTFPPVVELSSGIFSDADRVKTFFKLRARYTVQMLTALNGSVGSGSFLPQTGLQALADNIESIAELDIITPRECWSQTWVNIFAAARDDNPKDGKSLAKYLTSKLTEMIQSRSHYKGDDPKLEEDCKSATCRYPAPRHYRPDLIPIHLRHSFRFFQLPGFSFPDRSPWPFPLMRFEQAALPRQLSMVADFQSSPQESVPQSSETPESLPQSSTEGTECGEQKAQKESTDSQQEQPVQRTLVEINQKLASGGSETSPPVIVQSFCQHLQAFIFDATVVGTLPDEQKPVRRKKVKKAAEGNEVEDCADGLEANPEVPTPDTGYSLIKANSDEKKATLVATEAEWVQRTG